MPGATRMDPDDHVCLCFRVSLRKIRTFLSREDPPVASLISECLGAGTGCQWCVPFLKHLHAQHQLHKEGRADEPDLRISPEKYAAARIGYHKSGSRDPGVLRETGAEEAADGGDETGAA